MKQRYETLLAAKGKPSLEFGFFGPRQSDIDGAGQEYGAAFRKAEADSWFGAKAKGDADFKDLQSRAMDFVRGVTPAIALADDFKNAQKLMNSAVAAGAISSDQAAQALRAYELQVQQTIDPSKTLVDAIEQETQALNLQAGAARNAWTALQQLQRQQPGREIGFDQAAGVQQGVAERSDAQSADRARQVDAVAAAERRLNQARIAGNPREVARATVDLGVAQKQAAGETVNAAEKTALHAQAQRGATAEIDAQTHQLGLQVDAAERSAAAAGKGEAAQRRAAIETQVATAALKGLGLETRMALEMQEAYVAAGVHAEFAGQIDQEAAANERLVAALGQGVAAYRDAEIYNRAVAQALKETPPEYDAAGNAAGRFSEAISANVALLKKQQGAADSVDLGKYVEKLENARKDLDFRGSAVGMSEDAKAVAKAQYDTAEALRRQYGEYERLAPAQQRQWDTAVKLAEENARIEVGVKRQEDAWNEVGQIGERAFDRIGDAVTQLFLEGKNKAISWGSLMKSVAASVAADIAKMGVNDIKRLIGLGGSGGGLLDLFGGSGGGRSANGQAGGQPGGGVSISGLGDLFSGGASSAVSSIWGNSGSLSGYLFGNAGDPMMTGLSNSGLLGSGGGIGGVPIGQIAGGIGGALGLFSAFKQFSSGNVLGGVGSAIGGGLGLMSAFAPAAFAALGPLGPIAMVAAPLLGSLFGGSAKPSNKEGNAIYDFSNGVITTGGQEGKKFSQENRDAAAGWAEKIGAVAAALDAASTKSLAGGFKVGIGDRDGVYAHYGSLVYGADKSEAGMTRVSGQLLQAMAAELSDGFSPAVQTALKHIDWSDIETALQDISFAESFAAWFAAMEDGGYGVASQIAAMMADAKKSGEEAQKSIVDFRDTAIRLGLATEETVNPALRRQLDAIMGLTETDQPLRGISAVLKKGQIDFEQYRSVLEKLGYTTEEIAKKESEFISKRKSAYDAEIDKIKVFGAEALNQAITPSPLRSASAVFNAAELDAAEFTNLTIAFESLISAARNGAAVGDDLRRILAALDAELYEGSLSGEQYKNLVAASTEAYAESVDAAEAAAAAEERRLAAIATGTPWTARVADDLGREAQYRKELATAQSEGERATLASIHAIEKKTLAEQRQREAAAAAAAMLERAYTVVGRQYRAATTGFDAKAMEELRQAGPEVDLAFLTAVQAAERQESALKALQSMHEETIAAQIAAIEKNTAAVSDAATADRQTAKRFADARDQLKISEASYLNPEERIDEARRQFSAATEAFEKAGTAAERAQAGADLTVSGDALMRLAFEYFRTTDYTDIKNVEAVYDKYAISNDNAINAAENQIKIAQDQLKILQEQRDAINNLGKRQIDNLSGIRDLAQEQARQLEKAVQTLDFLALQQPQAPSERYGAALNAASQGVDGLMRGLGVDPGNVAAHAELLGGNVSQAAGWAAAAALAGYTGPAGRGEIGAHLGKRLAENPTDQSALQALELGAKINADPSSGYKIAAEIAISRLLGYSGAYTGGAFGDYKAAAGAEWQRQYDALFALAIKNAPPVRAYADGGLVTGGTPGIDSVPALLMPGERVLSVPHSAMLERIYAMAAAAPANDRMPPRVLAAQSRPITQPSPPELAELVTLLRELIALIGAAQAKALAQSGAIGGATLEKLEELIREAEEQSYQARKAA
ncbi:MAG TPA: hypothetical protein PKZ99_03245 [Azospirillaceae bacterium]|nr:hypothetical protein [Azospirillaceae bacterium]